MSDHRLTPEQQRTVRHAVMVLIAVWGIAFVVTGLATAFIWPGGYAMFTAPLGAFVALVIGYYLFRKRFIPKG